MAAQKPRNPEKIGPVAWISTSAKDAVPKMEGHYRIQGSKRAGFRAVSVGKQNAANVRNGVTQKLRCEFGSSLSLGFSKKSPGSCWMEGACPTCRCR